MEYLKNIFQYFYLSGLVMWAIVLLAFWAYYLSFYNFYKLFYYSKFCAKKERFFENYKLAFPENKDVEGVKENFINLRAKLLDRVDGNLKYALSLSAILPLLGLLGTISGLGLSFGGILDGSSAISEGISKALYTTQAGLSLALPSFVIVLIARRFKQKILINISKYEILLLRKIELK